MPKKVVLDCCTAEDRHSDQLMGLTLGMFDGMADYEPHHGAVYSPQ